ncbi:MAG: helix-turn-helix domain-containing protein [Ruminococcus sp.]|nr:helix-turn-helix domain-containing protein [Ruminococcus sp.]MCM1381601.1 helix-turn-helix domain-containing protein [Muribaculaceae bacterium]MCM1480966.1 helix-turn-helix domain-containing protein [Muribaculaceae bacterium]
MDSIKTGRFIAQLRKEKGLTQRQLAETLFISDKTVSKWETGKGMPEVSLMMPLCEALGISVNELLSGERLSGENYRERAEENIVNLISEKQDNIRRIISAWAIFTATGLAVGLIIGVLLNGGGLSTKLKTALAAAAAIVFVVGVAFGFSVDMKSGCFECTECHTVFTPDSGTYLKGSLTVTPFSARFRCPCCKKTTRCKRRFNK